MGDGRGLVPSVVVGGAVRPPPAGLTHSQRCRGGRKGNGIDKAFTANLSRGNLKFQKICLSFVSYGSLNKSFEHSYATIPHYGSPLDLEIL
ncbi:UNVERIFIED_CONTAM: hypothetical protein K2H54_000948 [Gekko kuhli]